MRAPDAPIGCPSATAPPLTLTRSSSMPSMRIEFSVTEANASLISQRSMSPGCRPAFSSAFLRRAARVSCEVGEVVGALGVGDDLGEHLLAVGRRPLSEASTSAPPPSLTPGELPAVCEPSLPTRPGSAASASSEVSRRGPSSISTTRVALAPLDGHRDDLFGQPTLVGGLQRELVRAQRPAIEIRARHLQLVADLGRLDEHLLAGEGVGEAVVDHRVERLHVAHAKAEARAGEQIGRLGHRLHAAADADLHVAGADRLVEDHRRAQARGADLVDRLRGDLLGDAGLDLRLAGGDLTLAGLQHLAHHDVLHLLGLDAGPLERRLDRDAAELGGVQRGQSAAHLADRGARGAENHCLGHRSGLSCGLGKGGADR